MNAYLYRLAHFGSNERVRVQSKCLPLPDLGSSDVNVLHGGDPTVPEGDGDARHLAVHVVLGLH